MSKIVLKISKHQSGRHTLSKSIDGAMYEDEGPGPLFGNMDEEEFNRKTDALAQKLRDEGHEVQIKK
jgi:hypothetical protein